MSCNEKFRATILFAGVFDGKHKTSKNLLEFPASRNAIGMIKQSLLFFQPNSIGRYSNDNHISLND